MSRKKTAKTNAMRILDALKIPYEGLEYGSGEGEFVDGVQAARMLGLKEQEVFKTLVASGAGGAVYVFVIPVAEELDLKKAAKAAGEKSIAMLPVRDIQAVTGYIRGGCTAVGMKKHFPSFIDVRAESLEKMYVSGGARGIQIGLAPEGLKRAASAEFADLAGSREGGTGAL